MQNFPERPDPDSLLRRVMQSDTKQTRAKLKIFFGFAPGVGKTYRMLQIAQDLESQHVDVVVGFVETHKRFDTTNLLMDLEILPRKTIEHRGKSFEEFDLDAALARHPKIILVDELAHTNVGGSRHAKRWQDIFELLDAGIDVYSTMNVQHVDSLNDVVAQITGVTVRETVPDSVLERADELELVDISPEELLQRLREGKVYFGEQAARAAQHFFSEGNLLALRELALRQVATHVDADVQEFREEHGVSKAWSASERILVGVGPSPASLRLMRAARRMAVGLHCSWVAVYVDTSSLKPLSDEARALLEDNLRSAEALGAIVVRLTGSRVSEAILAYARSHHITRIIVGKPTHSRLRDRLRGSLLDEIVRGSESIDVHVISGDADKVEGPREYAPEKETVVWRKYAWSAGLMVLTTLVAEAAHIIFAIPDAQMLYLLGVMIAALWLGRGPSTFAAGLSVALYDYFFVPPYHTFQVADGRYILTFLGMFGVSLILSNLTLRLKRQEQWAIEREQRTVTLYHLSRDLGGTNAAPEIAEIAVRHLRDIVAADIFILGGQTQNEALPVLAAFPKNLVVDSADIGVGRWVLNNGRMAGRGTDTLPGARCSCLPITLSSNANAVLGIITHDKQQITVEQRSFLEILCRHIAFALERSRLTEQARLAALRVETEEMRNALLSSVSHDLRTPLAAITGVATTLRDCSSVSVTAQKELLSTLCEEAERLERLVSKLLDMTRLSSGSIEPKREWIPIVELVGSALTHSQKMLGQRQVFTDLPDDLPLIFVDPVLIEQLLTNLLENAVKHTVVEVQITIRARSLADSVVLEIEDNGPGIPADKLAHIFERFYRGPSSISNGVGLGLAICRSIAQLHNATLSARNVDGGGIVFRLELPKLPLPPAEVEEDSL